MDDLLFFPFCANDASGIQEDWLAGAGCRGQSIHRIGDEFVVYDAHLAAHGDSPQKTAGRPRSDALMRPTA